MSVFGLINRDKPAAIKVKVVKMISGVGSSTLATIGAKTVVKRAKTLQIPMLVEEKTTGKRSIWPI